MRKQKTADLIATLIPGLILDRRYADSDDDIDALDSRIECIRECHASAVCDAVTIERLLTQCKAALAAWEGVGPAILLDDLREAIANAENRQ